ncbi:MAG: hypothetical protein P8L44_01060 [Opitutales bacterium]|jgi:hypothetical protein|nr:hypothetical protein [Opitutales bacterium]
MTLVLTILARVGLILTILPPTLFLFDGMTLSTAKWVMMLGTILWLVASPLLQKKHEEAAMAHPSDPL